MLFDNAIVMFTLRNRKGFGNHDGTRQAESLARTEMQSPTMPKSLPT